VSAATLVTVAPERTAPRRAHWYRQPALISGLVIILVIIGLAIAAPLITSYNPIAQNLNATLLGPSAHHLLGTDQFGRDVFTRLLYGARVDLKIGFIAVLFPFVLGTVLGSLAGYFGGWIELIVMRLVDMPNVISQAIIYAMSDIVQDILAIVTLGYFGLGIPPPTAEWGSMINEGQNFLTTHWQLATIPGLAVVLVGLGLSLIGDGLADLLRPGQS
jgi:ABC-type dipeptide/oligopeptide/nickel transport system permease subunit